MAVHLAVAVAKGALRRGNAPALDGAAAERHLELVGLTRVPHLREPFDGDGIRSDPVAAHLGAPRRLQLFEGGTHRGGICDLRTRRKGAVPVALDARFEQPLRGQHSGPRRHDQGLDREALGDCAAVERAGAPEQHEREVARVVAALHREHADRFRHRGVANGMDAERRLREAALHRLGEGADRAFRRIGPQANAARESRGVEVAQHETRIGHGGGGPAASVAGRAGIGSRALRPDLEHPRVVEPRDAAAAGSDGVDVDHRHPERIAADAPLARNERRPAARERNIRARTADVEGDELAPARSLPRRAAAQRTGGGTDPLRDSRATAPGGEKYRRLGDHEEVVHARALLPADLQHVLEALGHQETDARALLLEDRVGGDGRAVHEAIDVPRRLAAQLQHRLDSGQDSSDEILRRRGHLRGPDPVPPAADHVGEGASDVDPDPDSFMRFGHKHLQSRAQHGPLAHSARHGWRRQRDAGDSRDHVPSLSNLTAVRSCRSFSFRVGDGSLLPAQASSGEMREDPLDGVGRLDARDDMRRAVTHGTVLDVEGEDPPDPIAGRISPGASPRPESRASGAAGGGWLRASGRNRRTKTHPVREKGVAVPNSLAPSNER